MAADPNYRPCVGVMLFNRQGHVFVAKRIDTQEKAWQMPQGGIEPGETAAHAAMRELKEETGTDNAEIIAECPRWLSYDLPTGLRNKLWGGRFRGQTQKWFAFRFLGDDAEIDLETHTPEFTEWRWAPIDDVPGLIVEFKRPVYDQVVAEFRHLAKAGAG